MDAAGDCDGLSTGRCSLLPSRVYPAEELLPELLWKPSPGVRGGIDALKLDRADRAEPVRSSAEWARRGFATRSPSTTANVRSRLRGASRWCAGAEVVPAARGRWQRSGVDFSRTRVRSVRVASSTLLSGTAPGTEGRVSFREATAGGVVARRVRSETISRRFVGESRKVLLALWVAGGGCLATWCRGASCAGLGVNSFGGVGGVSVVSCQRQRNQRNRPHGGGMGRGKCGRGTQGDGGCQAMRLGARRRVGAPLLHLPAGWRARCCRRIYPSQRIDRFDPWETN